MPISPRIIDMTGFELAKLELDEEYFMWVVGWPTSGPTRKL